MQFPFCFNTYHEDAPGLEKTIQAMKLFNTHNKRKEHENKMIR
jgi:hypothetical protein